MKRADVQGILFDLDGVLYNADHLIPGAVDAIRWVQKQRIPHLFVTNTTSRPRSALVTKLAAFGFNIPEDSFLTPAVTAFEWLRSHRGTVSLFVRGATRAEFSGLELLPNDAESGADCVVVGDLGEGWDYHTLNRAFRLLHHNPDAILISLGMTRYWMTNDGVSLDVAPFVAALEHATDRKAVVFGKPAAVFFHAAAQRLGLPASELLMIGDDIETDIGGAQAAGLKAALVKTGKFRPLDLAGAIEPDLLFNSVADVRDYFID